MITNSVKDLQKALIQAIEAAGYSVSGPTDVRVAEHGEPVWVCEARSAIAASNTLHSPQSVMGIVRFNNFRLSDEFTVKQIRERVSQINVGNAYAILVEILSHNPSAEKLLFSAEVVQEYDDNGYFNCTRVDQFELQDAEGNELPTFSVNGTKYAGEGYAGEEDLDHWDDDYEGLLVETPYLFEDIADSGLIQLERSKLEPFLAGQFDLDQLLEVVLQKTDQTI